MIDVRELADASTACLVGGSHSRLRDALRHRATIGEAESFEVLAELLRSTSEHVDGVVLADRDRTGAEAAHVIRHLVRHWPRTAVVAYCQPDQRYSAADRRARPQAQLVITTRAARATVSQ